MMAELIYSLCILTSAMCAWLLLRSYRQTRYRLLLWSGLCFIVLTVNNVFVILDKVVFLDTDLSFWRLAFGLAAPMLLLVGLIMEEE